MSNNSTARRPSFQKAEKKRAKLRLALIGPSGSGKTFTALEVASGLGGRIAVIDTEHGSASLYADRFDFDVLELRSFAPSAYCEAIEAAVAAGYDVVVLDSLSHAWAGKGGALEMVDNAADRAAARSKGGSKNSFTAWREVTPEHNALIDAMVGSPIHVIATMRSKTKWVMETDDKGKQVPRRVGLEPVQRDGMEYEFTFVADMDLDHRMVVTKSRCPEFTDAIIPMPGAEIGKRLRGWLDKGAEPAAPSVNVVTPLLPTSRPVTLDDFRPLWVELSKLLGGAAATKREWDRALGNLTEATPAQLAELLPKARALVAANREPPPPPAEPMPWETPAADPVPVPAPAAKVEPPPPPDPPKPGLRVAADPPEDPDETPWSRDAREPGADDGHDPATGEVKRAPEPAKTPDPPPPAESKHAASVREFWQVAKDNGWNKAEMLDSWGWCVPQDQSQAALAFAITGMRRAPRKVGAR